MIVPTFYVRQSLVLGERRQARASNGVDGSADFLVNYVASVAGIACLEAYCAQECLAFVNEQCLNAPPSSRRQETKNEQACLCTVLPQAPRPNAHRSHVVAFDGIASVRRVSVVIPPVGRLMGS